MTISSNELRAGICFNLDGTLYTVIDFAHNKTGRGGAVIKVKIRNLLTGATTEKTFRPGDKLDRAYIERKNMQFLYGAQGDFVFMDPESYDQVTISGERMGEAGSFIKEGDHAQILFYEERPLGVELPASVELKVVETDPGVRGDTAAGGSKPAKLETGLTVPVPLFINQGDILKIDTRSKKYISRA